MARDFDFARILCTLEGPTHRERWRAFHRLYRLARRKEGENNFGGGLIDCLRVLGFHEWVVSLGKSDKLDDRVAMPVFLRKMTLETTKRRRLYGSEHEELRQADCYAARKMAEKYGVEMTPDQCAEVRHKVAKAARQLAVTHGVRVPESEVELLKMVSKSLRD